MEAKESGFNFAWKDTMVLTGKNNFLFCNGELYSRDEFYTHLAMETNGIVDEYDFDIYFSQCVLNAWCEANLHT